MKWLSFLLLTGLVHAQGVPPEYCHTVINWYHCGHVDERRPRPLPVMETIPTPATALIAVEPSPIFRRAETVIERRVEAAGGRVDGIALRASLAWFNYDDLDLHIVEPSGNEIFYDARYSSRTGGLLDVDMNAGYPDTRTPVENIIYPWRGQLEDGTYLLRVNSFSHRESTHPGFTIEIEADGKISTFTYPTSPRQCTSVTVAAIHYRAATGFEVLKPTAAEKRGDDCASHFWSSNVLVVGYTQ